MLASVLLIAVAVVVKYRSLAKPKNVITRLHANVPEARFKIDGQPADAAGLLLAPDQEHVLEASSPGYQTAVQKLAPSPNPFPAMVEFNLTPLLPQLEVSADLAGTLAIGDQTPVPLQPGSVTVNQLASGNQVIKVLAADHPCLELPIDIQPGKPLAPPNLSAASGCSVAVVSVLGTRAHLYAGPNLSGGIAGQAQQLIPAEGLDIEATETGAEFTLSNGRTLTIQSSTTPLLSISLNATRETAAPAAAPEHHVKANAYVVLQSAEPEAEVHVDGVSRGTVSPSGIILVSIEPGNHRVFLSKAHCEDSPVVPVTVRTGQTVHLGGDKFPLERQGALLFKISPPAGTASYHLADQPQSRTAHNGDTAWMKPGKYKVQIEAAGYSPVSADYEVKPGATVEVNGKLRSGSDTAAAPVKPARDSGLEDEAQWSHDASWWVLKKQTYGWMRARQGLFNITIERSKKGIGIFKSAKKVEWAIDYRGEGDRVVYWIDNKTLHRIAYSDGHPIKEEVTKQLSPSGDYHLVFDVSPQRVVVSDSSGEKLDEFERPNPTVALGKIGFHGEIAVTIQQLK